MIGGNDHGKGFKKGVSGNPGGRPNIAKAWAAATGGKRTSEVTADALKIVYDRAMEGPDGSSKGDADWRFAVQKVLDYTLGAPKQSIELSGDVTRSAEGFDPASMSDADIREAIGAIGTLKRLAVAPEAPPGDGPTEH